MKCTDCRQKHIETTTLWERFKQWSLHKLFHEELIDFNQDKYTQGFGDGYKSGFKHSDDSNKKLMEEYMSTPSLSGDWLVSVNDVITANNGKLYLGEEVLSDDDLKQLKEEVKALNNFKLWRIMQETLKQKAVEKSVLHSKNFEETLSGKLMIHSLGVIKSIVVVIDRQVLKK